MLSALARGLLRIFGWAVSEPAERPPCAVLVSSPHTLNRYGFVAAMLAQFAALPEFLLFIAAHYESRQGKHPELAAPIRWLE